MPTSCICKTNFRPAFEKSPRAQTSQRDAQNIVITMSRVNWSAVTHSHLRSP